MRDVRLCAYVVCLVLRGWFVRIGQSVLFLVSFVLWRIYCVEVLSSYSTFKAVYTKGTINFNAFQATEKKCSALTLSFLRAQNIEQVVASAS
jgi:hypothetical protein